MARSTGLAAGLVLFVVLATLNSAGYRYGASDQAFYVPAVIRHLHPDYYPHDAPLIDSQARLTVADEAIAAIARVTRTSLPALFVVLYAGGLVLLALAAIALGRIYFRTQLATLTLVAGLTMRHAIAKTGTNTLEGYFHPRQVAFALGAWAVVNFLNGRDIRAAFSLSPPGWSIPPRRCGTRSGSPLRSSSPIAGWSRPPSLLASWAALLPPGHCRWDHSPAGCTGWIRSGWRRLRRRTTSFLSSGRGRCGCSTCRIRR